MGLAVLGRVKWVWLYWAVVLGRVKWVWLYCLSVIMDLGLSLSLQGGKVFHTLCKSLDQGWAINFPKGPHEIVGLLWRAGPIG